MLFPSHEFLFYFLPLLLGFYYLSPDRHRRALLTVASYFFYGWWNPKFISLLLISTVIDYFCGGRIHRSDDPRVKKRYLILSVLTNLGLLGFFKYFMFANQSLAGLFSLTGASYPAALLNVKVLLPIGISFFTFQSMSYTIDIYRGRVAPAASIVDFACYIALFPQLIAGPIVRFSAIAEQLRRPQISLRHFNLGLQFFIIGLAKKVLIADNLSPLVEGFFDASSLAGFGSLDAALATVAYSMQIYFDFSGYSDMAVGLGYFLGYRFPQNFNSPYKSPSISEFWRRWHMTLSYWLRDYLYIPLGGSRRGRGKTYRNLAVTMLLGGLWHGANWTFVLWGAWHGLWLMIERALGAKNPLRKVPRAVQTAWTFVLVCLGWVVFRAHDAAAAGAVYRKLFAFDFSVSALWSTQYSLPLLVLAAGVVTSFALRNSWQISTEPRWTKTLGLAVLFVLSLLFLFGSVTHPFLYFQF